MDMGIGDIFRSLFERRGFPREGSSLHGESEDDGERKDFDDFPFREPKVYTWSRTFVFPGKESKEHYREEPSDHGGFPGPGMGIFGFPPAAEMFREMDDMFRKIDEMVQGSAFMEVPRMPSLPGPDESPSQRSPRDEMLKQPFASPSLPDQPATPPHTPSLGLFGSILGSLFGQSRQLSIEKKDTDLDEEVKSGDLSSILSVPAETPSMGSRSPDTFHRVQVYTYKSEDGMMVERQTVKDNSGETTTVTKSLGDQKYRVTTKTNPDGSQRQSEDFINISQDERERFKSNWREPGRHVPNLIISEQDKPSSLFRDLFKLGFPGFPST